MIEAGLAIAIVFGVVWLQHRQATLASDQLKAAFESAQDIAMQRPLYPPNVLQNSANGCPTDRNGQ
jgi:hypothetical protein